MLINNEVISNIGNFLAFNQVSLYFHDVFLKDHCSVLEDLKYLESNTLLSIDNMLSGYGKKKYLMQEDLKCDLIEIKNELSAKSILLDELISISEQNQKCKEIIKLDEFKELSNSLEELSKEVFLYQGDHFYDIYN